MAEHSAVNSTFRRMHRHSNVHTGPNIPSPRYPRAYQSSSGSSGSSYSSLRCSSSSLSSSGPFMLLASPVLLRSPDIFCWKFTRYRVSAAVTEESRDSLSYNSDFASKAALQTRHNSLVQDWKEETFFLWKSQLYSKSARATDAIFLQLEYLTNMPVYVHCTRY